jgi:hypothetical protein
MKKVKFVGTVDTLYFVPDGEDETGILYLNVTEEQKLPDGKNEKLEKPRCMRFMLSAREMRGLNNAKSIFKGDRMSIYVNEDSAGELSYSIGLVEHNTAVVDAKEYAKHLTD